jgi:hypothetical protein
MPPPFHNAITHPPAQAHPWRPEGPLATNAPTGRIEILSIDANPRLTSVAASDANTNFVDPKVESYRPRDVIRRYEHLFAIMVTGHR